MNWLDIVLVGIVLANVAGGFHRGFARSVIGIVSMVLGVVLGFWFYGVPGVFFGEVFRSEMAAKILGFLAVYFAVVAAGALIGFLLSKAFKWVGLSWLDRSLGAGVGLAKGAIFVIAFVALLLAFSPKPPPQWIANSRVVPYASDSAGILSALAPSTLKEAFADTRVTLEQIWKQRLRQHAGKLLPSREE
jgi:membrane protein required for colicin V production